MPQLYVVGFLTGSLAVVFDLSWNTLFVTVTERDRYVEAMALLNGSRSLASVGGPTLGGILVQVFGAPLAMLVDSVSYLGSVFFLRRIRSPEPPVETEEGSTRERLLAGLSFTVNDSIMRPTLLSIATINLFTFASSALFILYATTELGVSPGALGLALGTGAIGAVIGALVATRIGRRIGLGPAYALGCLVFPASLLLIPIASPGMPMPVILALLFGSEFGAGLGVMILDVNVGAIIYARTPDRIRARAGGAFRFVNYGVRPVGALLGGLLGTAIGVHEAIWVTTHRGHRRGPVPGRVTGPSPPRPAGGARDVGARSPERRPTPSGTSGRPERSSRRPRPPGSAKGWTTSAGPVPSATRKASDRAAAGRTAATDASGPGRCETGRTIPPSSRNAMNRPLARASVASARSAPGEQEAETGERERPEDERPDERDRRSARLRSPAEDEGRDRDEQDDLPDLDGEDGRHLGDEQVAPGQRRATEPLEDPVVPLVGGRDPEVDEARRHDRQGQCARQQEVHRCPAAGRQDADAGEEEQDDDRDDDRDQDVLAASGGQPQLHRGLGQRWRPTARPDGSRVRLALVTDQLEVDLLEAATGGPQLDDESIGGGAPAGEGADDGPGPGRTPSRR